MGRTIEEKLLKLTDRWGYNPEDTSKLIEAVLSQPLIYTYPGIFYIFRGFYIYLYWLRQWLDYYWEGEMGNEKNIRLSCIPTKTR